MSDSIFPWQHDAWRKLQQLHGRMPHALLFYGAQGIGKAQFAEQFAKSLLCEQRRPDGHACGVCLSCGWFDQYSHPDFRRVRPEALDDEAGAGTEEGEGAEAAAETKKEVKSGKTPSKEIKIAQIRALADFMNISTHRHGTRVVIFYPAEAMNTAAANALLKTLEEPPPNTVLLLVSHQPERLLPTLVSRCRKYPLPLPSGDQALQWLSEQGVEQPQRWLAEQGGAPLAAYEQAQAGSREELDELLRFLAQPDLDNALRMAERLQKTSLELSVASVQRWVYDLFSSKLSGTIRYYPHYRKQLIALAERVLLPALLDTLKSLNGRRAVAGHPLSPRLFIEDMLLEYTRLFNTRN